jgi:hypothetical protein
MQKKLFKEALGDIPSELMPDHEIGGGNPVINDDFLEQVRNGMIRVHHAEVEKFTKGGIELSDGAHVEADVIISCTGYQVRTISQINDVEISANEICRLTILFYPVTFGSQSSIINRITAAPTEWIYTELWFLFSISTYSFPEYSMHCKFCVFKGLVHEILCRAHMFVILLTIVAHFLQLSNCKHVGQMQYFPGASTYRPYRKWRTKSGNATSGILNRFAHSTSNANYLLTLY